MFYTFRQNNVRGLWHPKLPRYLVIEAINAEKANRIAEDYGLDFDDFCPCCGHRWKHTTDYDGHSDQYAETSHNNRDNVVFILL
jgi:hypothetical protein